MLSLTTDSCQPSATSKSRWGSPSKVLAVMPCRPQPSARRAVEASSTSCPGGAVLISSTETPFFQPWQAQLPLPCPGSGPGLPGAPPSGSCQAAQQGAASLGNHGISPECSRAPSSRSEGWTTPSLLFPCSRTSLLDLALRYTAPPYT